MRRKTLCAPSGVLVAADAARLPQKAKSLSKGETMKYHRYSATEKAAYRAGKIRAYYQNKRKSQTKPKMRFGGSFDVDEAYARALERSYGKEEAEQILRNSK